MAALNNASAVSTLVTSSLQNRQGSGTTAMGAVAFRCSRILTGLLLAIAAPPVVGDSVQNYTGLPVFPSLSRAAMDKVSKTDTLGHWCSRFAAETSYPLGKVEDWYRKALVNASETNLADDDRYKPLPGLTGIKLALGLDYVTVFRVTGQTGTSIELFKCSPPQ